VIGVIDYGTGNLASVTNALDYLEAPWRLARSSSELLASDTLVFPGVGAAGPAMARLRATGLDQGLHEFLRSGRPYLGICLGMQLLFQSSAEDDSSCLSYFPGQVGRMATSEKLPHVGWNTTDVSRSSSLLEPWNGKYFYFTHSYVVQPAEPEVICAVTDHGGAFVSAVAQEPIFGVQFHPERSGRDGLQLLARFCRLAEEKVRTLAG